MLLGDPSTYKAILTARVTTTKIRQQQTWTFFSHQAFMRVSLFLGSGGGGRTTEIASIIDDVDADTT